MSPIPSRPRVAIHKFSSCDGCQLAFLNMGEELLTLAGMVDITHFAEAGPVDPASPVDIAFVEGSISTPEEIDRIQAVRRDARFLVTMGACATSGGLQALRNLADSGQWVSAIYPRPEFVSTLDNATAIRNHVEVDLELWGCPINTRQVISAIRSLLFGVPPLVHDEKLCLSCKTHQTVCVMVTRGIPCLGPVTRTGCGALCPSFGRDCYGCYGPAENSNTVAFATRLAGLGLVPADIARRFLAIHSADEAFRETGIHWMNRVEDES